MFGILLAVGITIQGQLSQRLIEHPIWLQLLESHTAEYVRRSDPHAVTPLTESGVVRGWRIGADGIVSGSGMPAYFGALAPGFYSESDLDALDTQSGFGAGIIRPSFEPSFAVLVTPLENGRLVMAIDMTDLENQQNSNAILAALFAVLNLVMVGTVIWWLHNSLGRPIKDIATRMRNLDPNAPWQRLPTMYRQSEMEAIAMATNTHLDRVQRFIERERSLLDQASHEFRTPIAVIAGAVDLLRIQGMSPAAAVTLGRIDTSVQELTGVMVALLYLSREPDPTTPIADTTRLHELIPEILSDHAHLLDGKPVKFSIPTLTPCTIAAPAALVRIAIANLIRNAAENTSSGEIRIVLETDLLCISDSGEGFDAVAAAARYTAALRSSSKPGGGLGLGLFLVRRICERFGWTLRLDSSETLGTQATINFASHNTH